VVKNKKKVVGKLIIRRGKRYLPIWIHAISLDKKTPDTGKAVQDTIKKKGPTPTKKKGKKRAMTAKMEHRFL